MTPLSTTTARTGPGAISAKPVATRPGSIPRTLRLGSRDSLENLVGNVVVSEYGLDVVQLLQRLDEAQHAGGVLALDPYRRLRHVGHPGLEHGHARSQKRVTDLVHFSRGGGDLENFFGAPHVRGAGVQGLREEGVLADLLRVHMEHPPPLTPPRHRAGRPQ